MRILNNIFTKSARHAEVSYLENLARQARQSRAKRPARTT
ncbi:hypothetical protein Aph01nite_07430 [Acrocarpospora phusangensis]|uniref:Uncharacterized protein n=1 Tax=Acrocarpospora phusangensis TaxID=1070424 RepID=A0A919Q5Q4_9ACTN|nr:hypothetical protein Aph01nite_07430 [Acrocarpospora phusangensis]